MPDIKIICISGMVEEEKIAELRASGADDFLHKPLDIDELIRPRLPTARYRDRAHGIRRSLTRHGGRDRRGEGAQLGAF